MPDLTLPTARAERDDLADRVDVLDKVGVLRTLPDDMHVTTDMVAEFYGVGVEAVRSLVKDNRAEVDDDGYRVVIRSEFEKSFGDLSNLDPRARQIALFPRRAVLRAGMLLRDSDVAKKVRSYLLDSEQVSRTFDPSTLSRLDILKMALAAEEEKSVLEAALESAAPAIAYHERHIAENDDVVLVEVWGSWCGLTRPRAFSALLDANLVYRKLIGRRWSKRRGQLVDEFEYRPRAGATFEWFELRPQHDAPRHHNGQVRQTLYVKAFYADRLAEKAGIARVTQGGEAA